MSKEIDEAKVLEILKNNPELLKQIIKSAPPKSSVNRLLNEYIHNKLGQIMPDKTGYYLNHIRANATALMRATLKVPKGKEVPDELFTIAREFYQDLAMLIKKYRDKINKE